MDPTTTSIAMAATIGVLLTLVCTPVVRLLAFRVGLVAHPKADRWHRESVPMLGGVAIALATLVALAVSPVRALPVWLVVGGAAAAALVGLVDDFRSLKPQTKLLAQLAIAGTFVVLDLRLRLTGVEFLDMLLTIGWVVGITNAFNLLDNMDGLAAGIAAIAMFFRTMFFLSDGYAEGAIASATVCAVATAFLAFNFNPARIFMGDTGSLFLGTMVAGLSLVGVFPYSRGVLSVLLWPVLVLLVPIFDTTLVSVARTLAGRPISQGGRDHSSHRLVALGLSERQAVLVLYFVATLAGTVALFSYRFGLSYTGTLVGLLVLGTLMFGTYLGRLKVYPEGDASRSAGDAISFVTDFSYKRQVATVVVDFALVVLAFYTAWLLRFEGAFTTAEAYFLSALPIVILVEPLAFALFRTYQGVWRYTGLDDLITLIKGATLGAVVSFILVRTAYGPGPSQSVFILNWILLVAFVAAGRLFMRLLGERLRPRAATEGRVLIYGAGDGGVLVLRELRNNAMLGRDVVGFIDDDPGKLRTRIQGVPVLGNLGSLEEVLERHPITEVVIATDKVTADRLARLTEFCERGNLVLTTARMRLEA
jgi:UDP-GlcNAc:undecaprenyl-phosphate GlcNAc-1-phosphate transferase